MTAGRVRGLAAAVKLPWLGGGQPPSDKLHLKDPRCVQNKIDKLAADGPSRLQLLTDFDRTLSRTHFHGKPVTTSYCIYEDLNHVTPEYYRLATQLREKYYPIEISSKLTAEQKLPHMMQWFAESFDIVLKAKVNRRDMAALVKRADLHLRCNTVKMFKLLAEQDVPILVFSAGIGDVVRLSLEQQGALLRNVTVLSNFIEYDKDGVPLKFNDQLLHMYNKNGRFPPAVEYFNQERIRSRSNAVLMGDSLGDCAMADGAPGISAPPVGDSTLLRIGFLDHDVEDRLESYLNNFDMVLVDDQTMNLPLAIFSQICAKS